MCAFECRVRAFECRELNVCCLDARVCCAYDVGRKRAGISSCVRSTGVQRSTVGGHRRRRRCSQRPLCLLPILVVQRAESASGHEAHDQLGRAHQRIHHASTQWCRCDWRVAVEFGQTAGYHAWSQPKPCVSLALSLCITARARTPLPLPPQRQLPMAIASSATRRPASQPRGVQHTVLWRPKMQSRTCFHRDDVGGVAPKCLLQPYVRRVV
jgi:hypothetical protein